MSEQKVENSTKESKEKKEDNEDTKVHSANSWETADLGGDDRKQKFLRLMGASKKEHQGRFVIGDHDPVHGRTKKDVSKMSDDLEEQYEQGMEHRRLGGRRGHLGLGFHEDEEEKGEEDKQEEKKDEEEGKKDEETGEEETKSEDCEKREHSEEEDNPDESPTKKMKLNFVKESS